MTTYSPTSPGPLSLKKLFNQYPDHQRMSFFAQDGHLIDDYRPHRAETVRIAIVERDGPQLTKRILPNRQTGLILRPNGIVPCCIYGRERRDYVVKWEERICFTFGSLLGVGAEARADGTIPKVWSIYDGPYRHDPGHNDWFKRALMWTPKRESAYASGGKAKDDYDAYEDMRAKRGRELIS